MRAAWRLQTAAGQAIQRAHDVPDDVGGNARVKRGSYRAWRVPTELDHTDIDVLLKQVRCKAVPQSMRGDALGDLRHMSRRVAGPIELTRRHRVDRVQPRKQPDLWPRDPPPVAQKLQQMRREHRVAILVALPRSTREHHTLAVDIRHLQRDDFRNAQAGTIGDAERSLVFDAGRRLQQARDFFGAEDDRQFARLVDERQMPNQVSRSSVTLKKEPERDDRAIDARSANMVPRHM